MEIKIVKKTLFLIVLLTMGLIFFAPAFASEEAGENASQAADEEVIAMCEDKYTPENYADETERVNLIDTCINESVNGTPAPSEEG